MPPPILGKTALGPGVVRNDPRIGQGTQVPTDFTGGKLCANLDGFSLHAALRVDGCNKDRLERLCRYAVRPPIGRKRLSLTESGKLLYRFKRPWAMESTGVYWIPLFQVLDERGFEVRLVDARRVKNVSGRKTDVADCQWLQQLHTYGLLSAAFRPDDETCVLRSYMRQRDGLVTQAGQHIQHMQRALELMNVKLTEALSDVTGATGMAIIDDILAGKRDPVALAKHRHVRCKQTSGRSPRRWRVTTGKSTCLPCGKPSRCIGSAAT